MREWVAEPPLIITEGRGVRVRDQAGRWYLDGVSSLWVNVHGHRRPEIDRAIVEQLGRVAHSTLLGCSSPPAILLAQRLVQLAPPGLTKVFYSDDGSTAVEVALKMALQYWQQVSPPRPRKTKVLAYSLAYHGDTVGAVSVGGIDVFHSRFAPYLFPTTEPAAVPLPLPPGPRLPVVRDGVRPGDRGHARRAPRRDRSAHRGTVGLRRRGHDHRPARLSAAAPRAVHTPPRPLDRRRGRDGLRTDGRDVRVRTGGCDTRPDGRGEGTHRRLPAPRRDADDPGRLRRVLGEYADFRTFFHGHSYTGNALACAAALANLDVFVHERVIEGLAAKVAHLHKALAPFADHPKVGDVRQCGLMVGIELVQDRTTKARFPIADRIGWKVSREARSLGLLTRPLGDVLVLVPPLAASYDELTEMVGILRAALARVLGDRPTGS
jgi:adenosylmethionine-8-amino-7-oxononanoate aminotransferase